MILQAGTGEKRVRVFSYNVTGSSRNRPHERRVEITSTYQGGMQPDPHYEDVVIAYDRQSNSWVGVDAERLKHGGPKHNASSFVPISGFAQANSRQITVMPIDSNLFDSEFAAFFRSERLSEYLYNRVLIHSGNYDGRGPFSGNRAVSNPASLDMDAEMFGGTDLILEGPGVVAKNVTVPKSAVEAFQKGDFARVIPASGDSQMW